MALFQKSFQHHALLTRYLCPQSRKVVNLPPDKNTLKGKPSSQNNRKWAWLWCVIGASIVFRGPSSGQWPCDCNVFLTLPLPGTLIAIFYLFLQIIRLGLVNINLWLNPKLNNRSSWSFGETCSLGSILLLLT